MGNESTKQKKSAQNIESWNSNNDAVSSPHSRVLALNLYSSSDASYSTVPPISPNLGPVTVSHSFPPPLSLISSRTSLMKPKHKMDENEKLKKEVEINNGITGKYVSSRIVRIVADFWQQNIVELNVSDQLEVGCSIFFGMLSTSKVMKQIMQSNFRAEHKKIETTSLKYLDMMGWLVRCLLNDNIDLYSLLSKLGLFHRKMGINIQHFNPMLESMHETFAYYFPSKYNIEIKYAMDEVFTLAAQIMTGEDIKVSSHLCDLVDAFKHDEIHFLQSIDICLQSQIGQEYLFRFLSQTWCDEIVIFLKLISKFKSQTSVKERFMISKQIIKTSIDPEATFTLNISYECRQKALDKMQELEQKFAIKEEFEISPHFYKEVEDETRRLVMQNHWGKFVKNISKLQQNSCFE